MLKLRRRHHPQRRAETRELGVAEKSHVLFHCWPRPKTPSRAKSKVSQGLGRRNISIGVFVIIDLEGEGAGLQGHKGRVMPLLGLGFSEGGPGVVVDREGGPRVQRRHELRSVPGCVKLHQRQYVQVGEERQHEAARGQLRQEVT